MSDTEACGSEEKPQFLPNCDDVNQFVQQTLKSVLQATKCSNEMPAEGDDFDFYSSYQGFQDVMNIEGKRILHMIQNILKHQNVKVSLGSASGAADIEDKMDLLMDANDQILERVGTWLDEASGIKKDDSSLVIATATPKQQTSASWNKKSPGASSTPSFKLLSARNIQRPQMKFKDKVDNRALPFIPIIKHKPNALKSLEESLRLSEGVTPEMAEKPDFKYPHPYQFELDQLTYTAEQLKVATITEPQGLEETPCTYISKVEQLPDLIEELKKQTEIAVDLEHHSYRTFQGITCLMQISTRVHDYLIDTLDLRGDLQCLNEVFTDPRIVKVFHGADMDVEWLQRDLGVYIVNMFDTGQAARVMNLGRFSLAHLLHHYCNVTADKQYQLADWRIRPLPDELKKYAREDTHYLLHIYDKMKNELLERGNESKNLLMSVLHRSTQVCLKVYRKPQCTSEGYKDLYVKNKKVFNSQQLLALSEMFAWRDETARLEDESYGYVLPNHMMLQICDILPREKQGVLACCNPIPPLVRQYLNEIHAIIKKAREAPLHKVELVKHERRPTHHQHPKYNVDSLLHCPHDLSHQDQVMETDTQTCFLDSTLVATKSSLFSSTPDSMIVVKSQPLLSVFNTKPKNETTLSAVQKTVSEIKANLISPYAQYLPDDIKKGSTILRPAKPLGDKVQNVMMSPPWKLLPSSVKRKPSEGDSANSPSVAAPPSKRSRTDLQGNSGSVNQHIRFTDNADEVPEKTEDDKKALPQDLEIPLRFQVPSKKKKKEKTQDIDIIDSVQKHLTHLRMLERSNDTALGQNPGDEQPLNLTEKIRERIEQRKLKKKMKKDKKKQSQSETVVAENKNSDKKEIDTNVGTKQSEETVEIADEEMKDDKERSEEFKPYDYSEGAKKLLQGNTSKDSDFYDPQLQMRKGKNKGSRSKAYSKRGQKSYTWKSKQ
ncbi:exosome component 10-like [Mercenaria mercenaria]|uniref:exosome component 10-like n=1 Tax=Mercenaria mercenaria TaxID=6596 RepID=UPI00234FA5E0|nr:exosome component 10-like [Mercenaria mercenaria]